MGYGQDETGKTINVKAECVVCPVCGAKPRVRCTFVLFKRIKWQPDFFHTARILKASGVKNVG